ncbi:MAG: 16S rRNA (guanine(527)-N(7))-methyltransferase RsmG [Actinobacteria bacterium]|nr:16S rRNA (guanine(527)-N(7))-methyltransferase RsmG [Actinomycetota bacterium]
MDEKLALYAELLRAYAPRMNLISPADLAQFESRHIADSLRLAPLLHELPEGPCMDVGSGAGLPGIPLACADPERRWVLLEPRAKRAAFLEEVVRRLRLDATVICVRAEQLSQQEMHRSTYALATARALAPPLAVVHLLRPFLATGGVGAVFLGGEAIQPPETELWQKGIAIVRK